MRQLSKSKLIAYRQCPKRLWLEIYKPELRDESGKETVFATGNAVGEISQKIFDPEGKGVNVDPNLIGWDESAVQTEASIKAAKGPVFEAYLQIPGALALADVLLPDYSADALQWEMIEVKSSTSVKDYHRDDAAIQAYVAERSGIPLSKVGLAHINSQFVYAGDGNYDGLLHVKDLTEDAKSRSAEVEAWLQGAQKTAAENQEPDIEVGSHCKKPFTCGFHEYCHKGISTTEDPFSMLPDLRAKKRATFEAAGIESLEAIPEHLLSPTQTKVRSAHLKNETSFDHKLARQLLGASDKTAYFLDYETIMFAVPIWRDSRPYQNLPFQYSLHRLDTEGRLEHREFLAEDDKDPRRALAEQMIEDCGPEGPIFVYNATFERAVTHELAALFPDLSELLKAIIERFIDLYPIAKAAYYNPSQHGSWSLKAVAPAISTECCYDDLEGVKVGSDAGAAFLESCAAETSPERRKELREQMLKYCKLDTLATVKIWEFFK
jgi:predicted RecB family nuclease